MPSPPEAYRRPQMAGHSSPIPNHILCVLPAEPDTERLAEKPLEFYKTLPVPANLPRRFLFAKTECREGTADSPMFHSTGCSR